MHCLCLKTFALYGSLRYIDLHYKDLLLYQEVKAYNEILFLKNVTSLPSTIFSKIPYLENMS